jgi:microcystin-dependent protein
MSPQAIGVVGSSFPHNNYQPLLVLTFIIAQQGIFPARG